jgi:anti-sigma B factor antagonist
MNFSLKTRDVDDVVIFDLSGKLTIGGPVAQLRESLRAQLEKGARKFVLNLRGVTMIDSSALGELVSLYTTVRSKGGEIKLLIADGTLPVAGSSGDE